MRGLGLYLCLSAMLVGSAGSARAEAPWMVLPPTPTLPAGGHSGYAAVNGIRLWYEDFGGSGPPVLLLHGGLSARTNRPQ